MQMAEGRHRQDDQDSERAHLHPLFRLGILPQAEVVGQTFNPRGAGAPTSSGLVP
jgi:hypothetical protein